MFLFELFFFIFIFYIVLHKPYKMSSVNKEKVLLNNYITETLQKYSSNKKALTPKMFRKKLIMIGIFSLITFINISYYFVYHRSFLIPFIIEVVAIIYVIKFVKKISVYTEAVKQIKASPDDNMEYIIASIIGDANTKNTALSKLFSLMFIIASIGVPLCIFSKPYMIFEKEENGYAVRYYTLSIFGQEKDIVVPSEYNGKPVVGIRGNVFQNLTYIESVSLPDTIEYIRGHAFDGTSISSINLSSNLTFIGGYAFANTKLKSLSMPSSVLEVGGGVCSNCRELEVVDLSHNLVEIRGNSFENCVKLKSVVIPEGVTRIGGHAFHGCTNLESVILPVVLEEIGSSAFRDCYSLKSIELPHNTIVNERAFKNTSTLIYRKSY